MDPYEDPNLPTEERVADLLARMTVAEKAGLMIHSIVSVTVDGTVDGDPIIPGRASVHELVAARHITHLNVHLIPDPSTMARWTNAVQCAAAETRLGIPVTISTDPRHSSIENWGASFQAGHFSAWPEPIGLGAIADVDVVREFADIARSEYRAVGIHSALHPTLDVATEPRWARQYSTFGQDATTVGQLGVAYVDGFEGGEKLATNGVACMAKHFPGGGAQGDGGEDTHFPYGKHHVYPGDHFEYHLEPFRQVISRGVSAIMPAYGVPVGVNLRGEPVEEVGIAFNKQMISGLLRDELGFDGVVCTDWSVVTGSVIAGKTLPARAWGVEELSDLDRAQRVLEAGCDQFGGEDDPTLITRLVDRGSLLESRLDESVRRLLRVKFELGLFDDPFVNEGVAAASVGTAEYVERGLDAQARSIVLLKRTSATLPIALASSVYAPGIPPGVLAEAGLTPVESAEAADMVLLRMDAPFEPRDEYALEGSFHAGPLAFSAEQESWVASHAKIRPVILAVHMDRPALIEPLVRHAATALATFGASDRALLDVLVGARTASATLPFDIPSTAEAVQAARPDVPGDTEEPLYRFGHSMWHDRVPSHSRVDCGDDR